MNEFLNYRSLGTPIPPRKKKIKVKKDGVYLCERWDIDDPVYWKYEYFIDWNRINTELKLIHWIRHLSEKKWIDGIIIMDLIDA